MRKNRIIPIFLSVIMVIALTACTPKTQTSQIDPLMWIVRDGDGGCLYLMGTIHVGDERMETLPVKVTKTLDACDYLAVEFDITETESDMSGLVQSMQEMIYTDGTTIKDHIDEETYEKAKSILTENGFYNSALDYYYPVMWQQFISEAYSLSSRLSAEYGADRALISYAKENSIGVLDIESMEIQMDMLKSLSPETQEYLLSSTVSADAETYSNSLEAMYESWIEGDEKSLELLTASDSLGYLSADESEKAAADEYNEKMLTVRNKNMVLAAERYISGGKTVLLAVGTAHMFGDEGIISLLEDKGFTVEVWQ